MSTDELRKLLTSLRHKLDEQAPYFDDRLLDKIAQLETILDEENILLGKIDLAKDLAE